MLTFQGCALRPTLLLLLLVSPMVPASGCGDDDVDQDTSGAQASEVTDEGGEAPVCVERCKPLEQDCPPGDSCLPDQPGFTCQRIQGVEDGMRGGLHEACEAGAQTCNAGLVCVQAAVPGCTGGTACCVALCDMEDPECTDGTTCHPVFEAAAMCYEEVGVCVLF